MVFTAILGFSPMIGSAAQKKPTGTLTVAAPNLSGEVFNPTRIRTFYRGKILLGPIFDYLIGMTPDIELGPGLAERWESSSDGKVWTFHLRKGVKLVEPYQDYELTAEDVKFSLEMLSRKGSKISRSGAVKGGHCYWIHVLS